jgi:Fur family transcriptional regulator, ferric uptake regulator
VRTVDDALDALGAYLDDKGLKNTAQRRLITRVFFDPTCRAEHPTVEELFGRVRAVETRVGHATIYRTLKLLVDAGLATPSKLDEAQNQTRYEPEFPDDDEHHDHLICAECGHILEFSDPEIERLQELVAERLGFELTDHTMVLYGRPKDGCDQSNCRAKVAS